MIVEDLRTLNMYLVMHKVFYEHTAEFYDVDMFSHDICEALFTVTDPQDVDEDDFMYYQEALVLLLRDDLLLNYFGLGGLSVLHAELMNNGEHYYVNKVMWKEA